MRKIINSTFITLDGAVENPHLWPGHDKSSEAESYDIQWELAKRCDDMLMGRRTYESFAAVWPTLSGDPLSDRFNDMRKQVASTTLSAPTWNNSHVIAGDAVEKIRALKQQPGGDIVQYGIGDLTFALLEQGLVDQLRLWVHPIILGSSAPAVPHFLRCPPLAFAVENTRTLSTGVVIINYVARHGG